MKILVLNGSPKSKSDTMILTNAFLRGMGKTGLHEITIIDVITSAKKIEISCCGNKLNFAEACSTTIFTEGSFSPDSYFIILV